MAALQNDLPKVSPSSLESVFGQCMYFGLSFGRIGSDFRSLLVPLFSQVVYDRFDHQTNKSEAQFAEAMSSFSLARTGSVGSNLSSSLIQAPSSVDQVQPPYTLMKFSPLAELCNGLIAAFNELRMCAPVQLVGPVASKLERTLCNCSQILADFHRQEKGAFTASEEQEFAKCLQLYRNDFMAYVQKILQLMFPPSLVSAQTGFPSGEIVKQELGFLSKDLILKPIDHLLIKEEPLKLPELTSEASSPSQQTEEEKPSDAINVPAPTDNGIHEEQRLESTAVTQLENQYDINLDHGPVSESEPNELLEPDQVAEHVQVTEVEPELHSEPSKDETEQERESQQKLSELARVDSEVPLQSEVPSEPFQPTIEIKNEEELS